MTRLAKWMRLLGFSRGALSRRSDRSQRMVFFGALVAALLAIPVAADAAAGVEQDAAANGHMTIAVLTEDSHVAMTSSEYGTVDGTDVKAIWRAPNGAEKSGTIKVTADLKADAQVPIWTDNVGNVVDGQEVSAGHVMRVFLAASLAVLGWLTGVLVCYVLIAWLLFRGRLRNWDVAWQEADREWRQPSDGSNGSR